MDNLPDKWWQWLLVYPTLAISLLTLGINTYTERSVHKSVWEKNIDCVDREVVWSQLGDHYKIGFTVCPSQDVRVLIDAHSRKFVKWITFEEQTQLVAIASESVHNGRILAQKVIDHNTAQIIIQDSDGVCYDQLVNIKTGEVIREDQVPCPETIFE